MKILVTIILLAFIFPVQAKTVDIDHEIIMNVELVHVSVYGDETNCYLMFYEITTTYVSGTSFSKDSGQTDICVE